MGRENTNVMVQDGKVERPKKGRECVRVDMRVRCVSVKITSNKDVFTLKRHYSSHKLPQARTRENNKGIWFWSQVTVIYQIT